jgi:hypothetical protein
VEQVIYAMTTRFIRTQVLLDPETRIRLDEMARQQKRSLSDLVRELLKEQLRLHTRCQMREAARLLRVDYETDEELTAFVALDGGDTHGVSSAAHA